jgi:hydrogenase maturation protease
MKTLLLGMGNPILSDDAVGVRLATELGRRLAGTPDLDVLAECSVGGLELLDVLAGYTRAIVLDSLQTEAACVGQWHAFAATALRDTLHLTNVHDANFATALELGYRLRIPLPAPSAIHIFAVEVADVSTFSEHMTPALEACFPLLADEISQEVRRLLATAPGRRPAHFAA